MKNALGLALKRAIVWLGLAVIGVIAVPIVVLLGVIHLVWSTVDVVIRKLFGNNRLEN